MPTCIPGGAATRLGLLCGFSGCIARFLSSLCIKGVPFFLVFGFNKETPEEQGQKSTTQELRLSRNDLGLKFLTSGLYDFYDSIRVYKACQTTVEVVEVFIVLGWGFPGFRVSGAVLQCLQVEGSWGSLGLRVSNCPLHLRSHQ